MSFQKSENSQEHSELVFQNLWVFNFKSVFYLGLDQMHTDVMHTDTGTIK